MDIIARLFLTFLIPILCLAAIAEANSEKITSPARGWINLYVSTEGNDNWSGYSPEPNAEKTDGPLATITAARDTLRKLRKERGELNQSVNIFVRGGYYHLEEPIVFTPEDSGKPGCPVTITAYPHERPIFSGGRIISDWRVTKLNDKEVWVADIPEVKEGKWQFSQLFSNDRRLPRTRLPKDGFYVVEGLIDTPSNVDMREGQDKFRFVDGDIEAWQNLKDIDIVVLHFWREERLPISFVNEKTREVNLAKKSAYRLTDDFASKGAQYYIENVSEALELPGQWYLDKSKGLVYYVPYPGQQIGSVDFVAPRIPQLLQVKGDPAGEKVSHINFEKLTFAHTEWSLPDNATGMGQASNLVPGAILFEDSSFCTIKDCEIAHFANFAIEFGNGCQDNRVSGSRLYDLGAGGIKIGHGSSRTNVEDNEIYQAGRIYHSAVGVWIGHSGHNRISHNHIHDLYYSGISVGWVWGYKESKAVGNIIEYNHIHHIGQGMLSDMGGIYSLGVSPGTVIRNNLIHDIKSRGYGGWGIYTDEGSSFILIENNVVYNTKSGGFDQHYGQDNIVRNNIFCYATEQQIHWTREEEHNAFSFERNIVCWNEGELMSGEALQIKGHIPNCRFDNNLYWDERAGDIVFGGSTFDKWRESGFDKGSLISDPKFKDPQGRDFSLMGDSPAFSLGFQQIDMSTVGPRKQPGVD